MKWFGTEDLEDGGGLGLGDGVLGEGGDEVLKGGLVLGGEDLEELGGIFLE